MKLNALKESILVWGPLSSPGLARLKEEGCGVLVPENRPSLLGIKHNIPLLKDNNIDHVYCTDNSLGLLFYQGRIKKTLIFSKKEGSGIKGVSGSLYAALLSRLHNVPIEIIGPGKVDLDALDREASDLEGKNFILEADKEEYIIAQGEEIIDQEVLF